MQIYIAEGTQQTGPFDLETIRNGLSTGRYTPSQLAWYEGAPGWEPISKLPGLGVSSAPPPPPPYPFAPPAPAPAGDRKRRSPWWKVSGFALGVAAMVDGIVTLKDGLHPKVPADAGSATPPGATRHFVVDRSKYSGDLAAHCVKFSFDYPEAWTLREDTPDTYVELRHMTRLSNGRTVPVENIAVSYAYSNPGYSLSGNLNQVGPALLEQTAALLTQKLPGCTTSPARKGRFGKYPAEERFGTARDPRDGTGDYFRMIVVPQQNDGTDGVYVNLWGNEASGAKSADTLGDGGGLRTIRDSFRFEP